MKQCSTEQCFTIIGNLNDICRKHTYEIDRMKYTEQLTDCERCGNVTSYLQSRYCEFCKNKRIKHRAKITKVHSELNQAVNNGTVVKPKVCEVCKKQTYLEAHHDDYSKPLLVKWVCRKCHKSTHDKKW